jgi:hypothetical protein
MLLMITLNSKFYGIMTVTRGGLLWKEQEKTKESIEPLK